MSGIFPNSQHGGLPPNPNDPNLPVQAFPPIIPPADTAALYYGNGCDVRLMPYVLNSIISEIISTVDRGEVAYRFASLQNQELAIRYLIQRGIPMGGLMVQQDTHTFNVTLDPPLTRYNDFLTLSLVPSMLFGLDVNSGYVRINVNGRGWVPLLRYEGFELRGGDLMNMRPFRAIYYQGAFYLTSRISAALPLLTKYTVWYVNANTGDDVNFDGTVPTVQPGREGAGPFRTIQRAVTEQAKYNMNGYGQSIVVADGDYGAATCTATNGTGQCYLVGNRDNPQNCRVTGTAYAESALRVVAGDWAVAGFRLSTGARGSGTMDGFAADGNCLAQVMDLRFGPCGRFHMVAAHAANLGLSSNFWIEGGAGADAHIDGELTANVSIPTVPPYVYFPTLTVLGPVTLGYFVGASALGTVTLGYRPSGIVSGAGYVTGARYSASLNGVIINLNEPPRQPFPGTTPGGTSSGGQYSG